MNCASIDAFHAARTPEDRAIRHRLRQALEMRRTDADSRIWHAHPVLFLQNNPIAGYSKLKDCARRTF